MVTCRQFTAGLSDYLDGTLPTEIRALLDRHLHQCPRCRIVCETTRKTVELYRKRPLPPEPAEVETRLFVAIQLLPGTSTR